MTATAILEQVRADGLLGADRVLVLYSGGRDSTCLLDLAARIAGPDNVTALHLNYALRDAADRDEEHCARVCATLGVRLLVRRPSRPRSGNLQAWARDERYSAAAQIAQDDRADVAVGHTADDQVETVLYRLASSPSRRALLGMRDREGSLVRPLLAFTRGQTAAYCQERGLEWSEDESNASRAYARNRIRAQLLPALAAVHPAALENVLALLDVLRDEAAVLDALVERVLGERQTLELSELRALPPALRRLVIQRLADAAAGGFVPGAARRAEEIAALSCAGSSELHVGAGLRAVAEYGTLRFEPIVPEPSEPDPVQLTVPGSVRFGSYEVRCELVAPEPRSGVLDQQVLGQQLLVRAWRRGDRMSPLGLHGSKTLQDLFTARRIPRARRAQVPVVEAGGEIAWVAGVATSERFKVTEATVRAAQLSVRVAPI